MSHPGGFLRHSVSGNGEDDVAELDPGWTRAKELFAATFEASANERRTLLERERDQAVRERVEALLVAHDSGGGPLDRPVIAAFERLAGTEPSTTDLVGKLLGPYRVIREVGRGGMGVVYEAVRVDGQFDQRVAVKTLRLGANSSAVLRRFHQERQILAGLQHPNIASLLDGAATDQGVPYFVLEFVDGSPIDAHCAAKKLDLRARLDVFRQVVGAVQHAHKQLVIHRDLKPSNVLVTSDGVVKLVDFGIATLLERGTAALTTDRYKPFTIAYASPEQVRGEPITTASDIYSLGVVLYRLLTGRIPLDVDMLSLDRAVAAVCNEMPPVPSSAVAPDSESIGLGPADRLRRTLRGDLDAIVMMALRKEPDRRYPTSQALGDDVQRYLRGLPVTASPDTATYRLRKFARRQRVLVSGIVIGALALLSGAGLAIWQAREARAEARRAENVARFLQDVIGAGNVSELSAGPRLGPGASIAELLDSAASRLPGELNADPLVRSAIHIALGRAYITQERWREARRQFDAALELGNVGGGRARIEQATALLGLAHAHFMLGITDADTLARRALSLFGELRRNESVEYASTLRFLGATASLAGNWQLADTLLTEALAIHRRLGKGPSVEWASTIADRAAALESSGRNVTETIADYEAAHAMVDAIPGAPVVEKSYVLWYVARAEAARGNFARADSLAQVSLHVAERAAGPRSGSFLRQLVQLATLARERGEPAAGRQYVERAMKILGDASELHPTIRDRAQLEYARYLWLDKDFVAASELAEAAYRSRQERGNSIYIVEAGQLYGVLLRETGRFAEAEPVLLDAYQRVESALGKSNPFTQFTAGSIVRLYSAWGKPSQAEVYLAKLPDSAQRVLRASLIRK